MNIIEATRLMADGAMIRRSSWPPSNGHRLGLIAEIQGPDMPFFVYVVGNDFRKRHWNPSVDDLTADDWIIIDEILARM